MKFQNVYGCKNLDFESTYESLCSVLPGVDKTPKGHVSFRISPKKIAVLISPKGKIQVAWENEAEKERFLPYLESLLITDNGQKAVLKPLYANVVNVPYPPPDSFGFAWCREKFRFFRQLGLFAWLDRRAERESRRLNEEIRELQAQIDADREISHLQDPELALALDKDGKFRFVEAVNEQTYTPEKKAIIERKWRKFYGLDTELPDEPEFDWQAEGESITWKQA